jgi:hypothetical protein
VPRLPALAFCSLSSSWSFNLEVSEAWNGRPTSAKSDSVHRLTWPHLRRGHGTMSEDSCPWTTPSSTLASRKGTTPMSTSPAPQPGGVPWTTAASPEEDVGLSHVSLSFDGGGGLTLWSDTMTAPDGKTDLETQLLLHPDRPVVIGRQQGGEVPYLDPCYVSTPILPDSGRSVLTRAGDGKDIRVSRGHFLLRGSPDGIVLLNGVPRRGGGIRPPLNGTWLLQPEYRRMKDGEEYLIQRGTSASIHLPNGTRVLINAG